jgi:hypothetical protein
MWSEQKVVSLSKIMAWSNVPIVHAQAEVVDGIGLQVGGHIVAVHAQAHHPHPAPVQMAVKEWSEATPAWLPDLLDWGIESPRQP